MDFQIEESTYVHGRQVVRIRENLILVRDQDGGDAPGYWHVMLGGHEVPNIRVGHGSDGSWSIIVDERLAFPLDIPNDQFDQVIVLLANAMAVAAGFSCYGVESRVINPYSIHPMPQMMMPQMMMPGDDVDTQRHGD